MVAEQSGKQISIEARQPSARKYAFGVVTTRTREARMVASVPTNSNVMLRTGDGTLTVERINGRLELRTSDGSISGLDVRGDLFAHTEEGHVRLEGLDGRCDVVTIDGSITLQGRLDALRARTGDKPQVLFFVPVILLLERRWSVLAAMAATGLTLCAAATLAFGPSIWSAWASELPRFMQINDRLAIPRLGLPLPLSLIAAVAAVTLVAFAVAEGDRPKALVAALAGALLVSPHSPAYDATILFVPAIAAIAATGPSWRLLPLAFLLYGEPWLAPSTFAIAAAAIAFPRLRTLRLSSQASDRDALTLRPQSYPLFDKLLFVSFVLLVPIALGSASTIFNDGDVSWHIATGQWIIDHGQVPRTDPFSFTMSGQPWIAYEWLAEVIYAAGFNFAGYAGVGGIVAAALMILHGIVFATLRRRIEPAALLLAFMAMDVILAPFILARPHVLVWPILAGWTAGLLRARDAGRSPPWALALLMLLWANMHGSYVIGFVIAGACALDALIAARWARAALFRWIAFGLLSLIAALVNANGLAGILHPLTVAGMESLPLIQEWQPSTLGGTPWFFAILLVVVAATLVKRPRLRPGELALLVVMLAMALLQVRHQSWLVIVAALVLTPVIARARAAAAAALFASAKQRRAGLAIAGLAAMVLIAGRLAVPLVPDENGANPRGLIANIPPSLRSQPVLNGYTMGGPLILAGIKPYIDGRADMYGDRFVADYVAITDGNFARFNQAARKYGIRWTILPAGNIALVRALDSSHEWRRVYSDRVGIIHVRTPAGAR